MEWLSSNPWVWGVVAAALAIGGLIFKLGQWTKAVNLNLGFLKENLESFRKTMENAMEKNGEKFDNIFNKIVEWQTSKTLTSESPLDLSELGRTISGELDVPSLVEELLPPLLELAKGKSKNVYDVQEMCFKFVREEFEPDDEFNERMKNCAYGHGIVIDEVHDVIAILLRKATLEHYEKGG